jgi:hypothetical protein
MGIPNRVMLGGRPSILTDTIGTTYSAAPAELEPFDHPQHGYMIDRSPGPTCLTASSTGPWRRPPSHSVVIVREWNP